MSIDNNILDRKAAEALHATVGDLLTEEVARLPSPESRVMFFYLLKASAEKNLPEEKPPMEMESKPDRPRIYPSNDSAKEALVTADEIESLVDEICPSGQDFAESVLEKTTAIAESVEAVGRATDNQLAALKNMLEGLQRWFD